jgi:hypothetical protein
MGAQPLFQATSGVTEGRLSRDCLRTFAAAMLCARNMAALIPPGCAAIQAAMRSVPATTPWDGALAAIFFPFGKEELKPQMNTDKH